MTKLNRLLKRETPSLARAEADAAWNKFTRLRDAASWKNSAIADDAVTAAYLEWTDAETRAALAEKA